MSFLLVVVICVAPGHCLEGNRTTSTLLQCKEAGETILATSTDKGWFAGYRCTSINSADL